MSTGAATGSPTDRPPLFDAGRRRFLHTGLNGILIAAVAPSIIKHGVMGLWVPRPQPLTQRIAQAEWLPHASDGQLDAWGKLWGLYRAPGERDFAFRNRMIAMISGHTRLSPRDIEQARVERQGDMVTYGWGTTTGMALPA